MQFIGIDIAKATFDLASIGPNKQAAHKVFPNDPKGFTKLSEWLGKQGISPAHFCMEATGVYHEALAEYLCQSGFQVSVINPAIAKAYAQSNGQRSKTDKADAKMLALYAQEKRPQPWLPPSPLRRDIRALVCLLDVLKDEQKAYKNRLGVSRDIAKPLIAGAIARLEEGINEVEKKIDALIASDPQLKEQRALLQTIDGVGEVTSAMILGLIDVSAFSHVKKVVAYAGLDVRHHESGDSVKKPAHLSKRGNSFIRKKLYMPATVVLYRTEWGKAYRARFAGKGKSAKVVICAMMRKLLQVIYGVLKSGLPFNPELHKV